MIRHRRVDCCQHRLLERLFVQRRRVQAVSLPVVQPAHTAPYSAFLAVLRPHHSAIRCPVFSAEYEPAECIFSAEFSKTCGRTFLYAALLRSSPCHLKLHRVKLLSRNDGFVVISDQALGKLSRVLNRLFVDTVINQFNQYLHELRKSLQRTEQFAEKPDRCAKDIFDWSAVRGAKKDGRSSGWQQKSMCSK